MLGDIVKLLITHGAEVDRVVRGHSPLSLAIINNHNQVCMSVIYACLLLQLDVTCRLLTSYWRVELTLTSHWGGELAMLFVFSALTQLSRKEIYLLLWPL